MQRLGRIVGIAAAFAFSAAPQATIGAKAGTIRYSDDEIRLEGKALANSKLLAGARVAAGQDFRTQNGRAEVALQPGNCLRLAPNTGLRMRSDALSNIKLEVRGTIILDNVVAGTIELTCGQSVVSIRKPGMYRLDCGEEAGLRRLRLYRGQADVAAGGRHRGVGGRESLTLDAGARLSKQERADLDEFDRWSASRNARVASKGSLSSPSFEAGTRAVSDATEIERILYTPRR